MLAWLLVAVPLGAGAVLRAPAGGPTGSRLHSVSLWPRSPWRCDRRGHPATGGDGTVAFLTTRGADLGSPRSCRCRSGCPAAWTDPARYRRCCIPRRWSLPVLLLLRLTPLLACPAGRSRWSRGWARRPRWRSAWSPSLRPTSSSCSPPPPVPGRWGLADRAGYQGVAGTERCRAPLPAGGRDVHGRRRITGRPGAAVVVGRQGSSTRRRAGKATSCTPSAWPASMGCALPAFSAGEPLWCSYVASSGAAWRHGGISRLVRGLGAAHHCRQTRITASSAASPSATPVQWKILSPRTLRVSYDLSRRFEVAGTLVATARRFMQ
jgi:hypothetical protein